MKTTVLEEFEKWYKGNVPLYKNKTREELAFDLNINKNDLWWAFSAGWNSRFETLTTDDI
jgi:hypothetical protein